MRVGVLQLTSVDSVDKNIEQIFKQLKKIEKSKPSLVCLPENSLYLKVNPKGAIRYFNLKEDFWFKFQDWCKKQNCNLIFGSAPVLENKSRYNAMILVTGKTVEIVYRKIHLFDVSVEGQAPLKESDNFEAGTKGATLDIDGFKIGLSICYDIRFSELYAKYAKEKVDLILIPSAFLVETGRAHWHVLNRARAIESQAYVISAAQSGRHKGSDGGLRKTYGHSLAVDPWGRVLNEIKKSGPGCFVIEVQKDSISSVRRQIPMTDHRRL